MRPTTPRRGLLAAGVVVLAGLAPTPATAAAAPFSCAANAVRGTVLSQPVTPVSAGGTGACTNATAGGATGLPAPLTANAVSAATAARGMSPGPDQVAYAGGGIAQLAVGLPSLPLQIPASALPDSLTKISLGTLPLLGPVTVDIKAALQALVPDNKLPSELLSVDGLFAQATGRCVDGRPVVDGSSSITKVKVLGQELGIDGITEQVLNLTAGTVDPSNIDITKVTLPASVTKLLPLNQVLAIVQPVLKPILDALPTIEIPAVLSAKVTPGSVQRTPTAAVATGARVELSLLGQSIADLTVGEAAVGGSGVDCAASQAGTPAPVTSTDLALQCTDRRIVLTDVARFGDQVRLQGVAVRAYAGRTVDLRFAATGRRVARTRVGADGSFTAVAPLPAARLRGTNKARYRASVGSVKSLNLKLQRRMTITSLRSRDGRVTIAGRVTRPLGKPLQTVTLSRRVTCKRNAVVKRFTPRADGTFRVTVEAPRGQTAAVYRLATKVRRSVRNRKLFPTFTLPRAVDLR